MTPDQLREEALHYHQFPTAGKISVQASKPCLTQKDLSLAYTPGVAIPCLAIEQNPELAESYTSRGNLVAVISNGTAVLGLGDIGALASKPVMEGKGVLFKRFADIDVFDLEIDERDPMALVDTIARLEPTFGGINLEDIRAPECFIVERELRKRVNIPVLHDDQHGTAVIMAAALINALYLQKKNIEDIRIVCLGAGAAGFACMKLIEELGAKRENIQLLDRSGVIRQDRQNLPEHKQYFASARPETNLEEAMVGADVFVGLSQGNIVSAYMLQSMADRPIVFAMANPDPEIAYDIAMNTRKDLIMATGRSDHPNQINNVLGFPFLFRGALDVRATTFNEDMKIAAVYALAELARKEVPESVVQAYGGQALRFGPNYILPKPFDPRLIEVVPSAVAKAACDSKVARSPIDDYDEYQHQLAARIDHSRLLMRSIYNTAKTKPIRLVLPEGEDPVIIRAAATMVDQGIAKPILIGRKDRIQAQATEHHIKLENIEIIEAKEDDSRFISLSEAWYFDRKRHGVLRQEAIASLIADPNLFAAMMVRQGFADGLLSGRNAHYPNVLRPIFQVLAHTESGHKHHVYGMQMLLMEHGVFFLADTSVNVSMNSEQLAELAQLAAETAKSLGFEPKIAMLSFSNFGSSTHPEAQKVAQAVALLHEQCPDLIVEGEMQADTALRQSLLNQYPFSRLKDQANILIFPSMEAGNISYKLLRELGKATSIGPILLGLPKQAHVLATGASLDDIVHMAAIASARAAEQ